MSAQVWTTVLGDGSIDERVPYLSQTSVESYLLPEVDIEAALKKHKKDGRTAPLYGVKIPLKLFENDGKFIENGDLISWKMSFLSENATTLNFYLSNFTLPEKAELWIYNKSRTMFSGPIKPMHIHNGIYATDLMNGEEAVLEVILPKMEAHKFSLDINAVIHGFEEDSEAKSFGLSGPCNIDVNCPLGTGWGDERDAVARIFRPDETTATGFLINNDCSNFRSLFMTVAHTLDGKEGAWLFRFNYDSPTCSGPEPATWLTYSGASVLASWGSMSLSSDFALLELFGSILNQPTLSVVGWDRSSAVPSPLTGIHHPKGDVKKITSSANQPTIIGLTNNGGTTTGTNYLELYCDGNGIVEGGSSGGPFFNSEHRAIGHQSAAIDFLSCENDPLERFYIGRFFRSWTGGGTSTTRLSDHLSNWVNIWLGTVPMTTNTITPPIVNGSELLCTSNKTFTLTNLSSNQSIFWTVSPTSLFATTSGASTFGTGAVATLRAKPGSMSGQEATLTYVIGSNDFVCGPKYMEHKIWVGKPGVPITNPSGFPTIPMSLGGIQYVSVISAPGASSFSGVWSASGSLNVLGGSGSASSFEAVSLGFGNFRVNTSNACGLSPAGGGAVNVSSGGGGSGVRQTLGSECMDCVTSLKAYPNPAADYVTIEVDPHNLPEFLQNSPQELDGELIIYDKLGKVQHRESLSTLKKRISTQSLNTGLYIVEIVIGGFRQRAKIVISEK